MQRTLKKGRKRTPRGIHSKPNNGGTVHWITPPEIVRALGEFDLDPCFHPRQFYRTAKNTISLPDDGLAAKWSGRIWLNPPYGDALESWLKRLSEHGNGIALVPSRTDVEEWFWPYIWEAADAVLFLRGRLCFLQPDGTRIRWNPKKRKFEKTGNAGHGSVLVAYGRENVAALANCKIPGRLVSL